MKLTKIEKKINDLKIQAMLFDMDIDWETASLVPKRKVEKTWLDKWKDKLNDSADHSVTDNGF